MAAGVELATAYVSLTVDASQISSSIGKGFAGGDKIAAKAGKSMGQALSQGVEQGTDVDLDGLRAEVETAEKQITATVERNAAAQAKAKRAVEIAEAELEEKRASGRASASQLMKAEDKLSLARQKSEAASLQAKSELEKYTKALDSSKTALREAERAAETAASGTKNAFSGVGDFIKKSMSGDFKGAFQGLKGDASTAAGQVEGEFAGVGDEAGAGFSDGFVDKLKGIGGIVAGLGIGLSITEGLTSGMERERLGDRLGAQLGLTGEQSAEWGAVAGRLYAGAYGESLEEASDAVSAVMSTLGGSTTEVEGLTATALDLSSAFGVDVNDAVLTVGTMLKNGLAADATEAFDLITGGMQSMPAAAREEVFPVFQEYAKHFAGMGIDGEKAMSMIVNASADGAIGMDKVGDAVKEFQIRSTDMSKASGEAYDTLGLDMGNMTARLLEGGPAAQTAMGEIVTAMQGIEDPVAQSQAAIALFGTPLEDLSVDQIPAFLAALNPATEAEYNFTDAAKNMSTTLNDNAATSLESFKRTISSGFVTIVGTAAGHVLSLGSAFAPIGQFLKDTMPHWGPFAAGVGIAAVAYGIWAAASWAVTAAQTALAGATFAANLGIAAIVVGVGLLVGGLIWAWNNVDWFRNGVLTAFNAVKTGIGIAVDFIKGALAILFRGDFIGGMGVEEDSGIVGFLFKIRTAALRVGEAAVWLWRNVMIPVWNGILSVIQWAWNGFIMPVFQELTRFVREIIAPAVTWLWHNVIAPAFAGISTAIQWAWVNVIKPVFQALWAFIRDTLAPVIGWLWRNIVAPYFKTMGEIIQFVWENVIRVAFRALEWFLKNVLGPAIVWLWENVVKPNFRFIGDTIKWTWENAIRPAFDGIKRGVDLVKQGFENAADGIAKAWGAVKEAVREPIAGVVTGVINPFIRGYNGLNDFWDGKDLGEIAGFRHGGYTGDIPKDQIAGVVHGREQVIPAEQTAAINRTNPGLLDAMTKYGAAALPFGGAENPANMVVGAHVHGQGSFTFPLQHAIYRTGVLNIAGSAPGWDLPGAIRMMDAATSISVRKGPESGGNSAYVSTRPYPATWSGLYSPDDGGILLNTANTGHLSVGMKRTIAAHEIGHALGLPHAMSWQGGNGAYSVMNYDNMFQAGGPTSADVAALAAIYGGAGKPGTASSPVPDNDDGGILDGIVGKLRDLVDGPLEKFKQQFAGNGFGDMALGIADKIVEGVIDKALSFGAAPVPGAAMKPMLHDNGGYLQPGLTLVNNASGKPEPVLNAAQWDAVEGNLTESSGSAVVELSAVDRAILDAIREAIAEGLQIDGTKLIPAIREAKMKTRDRSPL